MKWNRFLCVIGRITVTFIFAELTLLCLFPYKADPRNHRLSASPIKMTTSIIAGLVGGAFYIYVCLTLLSDPELKPIYVGVSFYNITLWNTFGFLLVVTFYGFQVVMGHALVRFINILHEKYTTFGLFYTPKSMSMFALNYHDPEAVLEIRHVYIPVFFKAVVCHSSIVVLKCMMSYFLALSYPGTNLPMLTFCIVFPYIIMASSSNYILLGLRKNAFLYVALKRKLERIYEEIVTLCRDPGGKSHYAKMKRFCELSDEVDSLCKSFTEVTQIVTILTTTYHVHMLLIVCYTVSQNLTLTFLLYRGVSSMVNTGHSPFHVSFYITATFFIYLILFEILLIVVSVDEAERQYRDVLRQVHLINYWQNKFDSRLRQSVS